MENLDTLITSFSYVTCSLCSLFYVYCPINRHSFFKKCAIPEDPDALKDFIQMIAKCGVDLASYSTAYSATDDDR